MSQRKHTVETVSSTVLEACGKRLVHAQTVGVPPFRSSTVYHYHSMEVGFSTTDRHRSGLKTGNIC